MNEIKAKAYAKLNLSLDVLGKMEDGYHDMLMVMQSVSLADDIVITVKDGSGELSVTTNRHYIPNDERNIAHKAARAYLTKAGIQDKDIAVRIVKNIPVCAGLGGGSSDGAAVLGALNAYFGRLSEDELFELSKTLGSDVPFCLVGGTKLASGRGEVLTPLKPLPDCGIVIAKPQFSVSTPVLFGELDKMKIKCRPNTQELISALERGSVQKAAHCFYNVFEEALPFKMREKVDYVKDALLSAGALGTAMSGTGSAVFGVFSNSDGAMAAAGVIKNICRETFFAEPTDKGFDICV